MSTPTPPRDGRLLTLSEAADILDVRLSTLVELCERGEIPSTRPGTGQEARLHVDDVLAYRANVRSRRRETLDELTREAAAAGLYDDDVPDYGAALKQARRDGS